MKRFVTTCLILILMAFTNPIVYAQTATEIEFWQSVKDGDDIDMLKAYLQEYPDGKFRSLAILKIKKLGGTVTSPKKNKTEVKPSATTIMADKKWCGRSSSASEMSPQVCLDRDGIPVPHKSWAEWISNNYFGKYEKHKAFAISDNSWGLSAYKANSAIAQKMALLDCNLRANKATTCKVVNVDGRFSEYSDYSKSSHRAHSGSGNLTNIAGRYKFELKNQEWNYDGVLDLNVNGSDIQGTLRICIEDTNCTTYSIDKVNEQKRGRFLSASLLKTNKGSLGTQRLWPKTGNIKVSLSSDATSIKGILFNWAVFEGEKYRH